MLDNLDDRRGVVALQAAVAVSQRTLHKTHARCLARWEAIEVQPAFGAIELGRGHLDAHYFSEALLLEQKRYQASLATPQVKDARRSLRFQHFYHRVQALRMQARARFFWGFRIVVVLHP